MHGNVWEWVWDSYDSYNSGKVVNSVGEDRAIRGGALDLPPGALRSANRNGVRSVLRLGLGGLRCARGPGPQR